MEVNSDKEDDYVTLSWIPTFTDREREIIEIVNIAFLSGVIALFGILANIINLVVFYQQGLNTVINICFFALAVSDLITLLFQEAWAIFLTPLFKNLELPIDYTAIQYMALCFPREGFARDTCLITAFITAERCLCIVFPQTVKQIITPKGARLMIVCVYSGTLMSGLPIIGYSRFHWRFHKDINRSILSISLTDSNQKLQQLVFFIHAIVLLLSVSTVVFLTLVLVVKLKETSAWRVSAHIQQKDYLSKRDRTTVSMVVLISIMLIACYTPAVILCIITFYEPEFNIHGRYVNLYGGLWSCAVLSETINSSVNIFLYLKMSTKYRRTFKGLFVRQRL